MSGVFSFRTCSKVNIRLCSKDKKINATNGDEHITMHIVWDVRKAILLVSTLLPSSICPAA